MSLSPVANRSFLHGDRKPSPTSEKIVYATLDSLALKRATLPLQLLPIGDDDASTEQPNEFPKKRETRTEAASRRSSFKVDATSVSSKQRSKYLLVISSPKAEEERSRSTEGTNSASINEQKFEEANVDGLHSINTDTDNDNDNGIDVNAINVAREIVKWLGNDSRDGAFSKRKSEKIGNSSSNDENVISSKCSGERLGTITRSSDDYEKIELVCGREISCNVRKETYEPRETLENDGEESSYSNNAFNAKSKSINDLTRKSSSETKLDDEKRLIDTFAEEQSTEELLLDNERGGQVKKKTHFAKNVLHFVPEYLVKGSKRRKRKKNDLSSSLSSLKALSTDTKADTMANARYRSRSLSREESRCLNISSPTNFVHVASATSPHLVSNENAVKLNLEQVVIMHEQKCATLPLLVARNEDTSAENRIDRIFDASSPIFERNEENEEIARRDGTFDGVNLKRELLSELRARSAKLLEQSQQVKTSENRANATGPEGKTHEPPCRFTSPSSSSRLELRTNSSFLWSDQAKSLLESTRHEASRSTPNESIESIEESADEEEYDDVGPLNLTVNQEDDYDDVGSPIVRSDKKSALQPTSNESDSIYDDVMCSRETENDSTVHRERNDRSIFQRNNAVLKRATAGGNQEIHEDESSLENESSNYLFVSNEYSSVDEEDTTDDIQDNDRDVYDDVGLPSEERVNSLYAGSTAGSIWGSTSANGKESEWEDLEDSTTVGLPRPVKRNNLSSGKSAETQVISSKKKSGQRWSRKVRRQRSRLSRRSSKSSTKSIRDPASLVAVSLGSGSVLLVGCAEKVEEWNKEESKDRTSPENSPRTQGLVQMRVIDLDEDVDTQETSCYVHEDNTSDDSTYESLQSFQPDDFSTDSETETIDASNREGESSERKIPSNRLVIEYLEAPTRPNPPPPREISLTRTLGRRIKMLRRTWSITKGSLGRMRRRTSVDDDHSCEENKESSNDHSNFDGGRYFGFARHFKKSVTGLSTFYLNGYTANGGNESTKSRIDRSDNEQPIYSNTNEEVDHYSVLVDQEPLYQFYAAAAARVAFDSNSDGYEEVEDMIPSQSTTDLAKPGHRTLWCQTPQVINSGLLQRLNTEERKIQEAKFEILTSEASYLNSLRVLRNEFLNESSINEILTPLEKDKLFGGIPSVLHASEQFLAELETIWRHDPMLQGLPDVLLKYADKCLDIYVAYCSNQVSIDATLKDLRTRKGLKFLEVVSQIEARSTCQSLSLHSFLMLPMQRITRLPLLTDAVLSKLPIEHTDRLHWEKVLSSLSYIVAECNEGARAAAKEAEMESLARKLEYSVKIKPIVLKGKHLIKSGPVVQLSSKADAEYKLTFGKKFNKTPLYLLLLTDHLLVAKYKSNTHDETYTVIDTCKRSLIALESVPEDSPFAGRNAMLLTLLENYSGHQVEYILTCESNTERQRWLEAVSPSKRGLVGETLYEVWDCPQVVALYCYPSNQPDELSLHPGDVINVFRKMSDGWYHGEKLLDGEQGWFPGNYTKEVASEHVRARNLKQRHRLLALNGNILQRKAKQQSTVY